MNGPILVETAYGNKNKARFFCKTQLSWGDTEKVWWHTVLAESHQSQKSKIRAEIFTCWWPQDLNLSFLLLLPQSSELLTNSYDEDNKDNNDDDDGSEWWWKWRHDDDGINDELVW